MTTEMTFTARGVDEVDAALAALGATLRKPDPMLRQMAASARTAMAAQFESEGAFLGHKWAPTKKPKPAGERILYRTGRLERSYTERESPAHIEEVAGDTLVFGSAVDYAKWLDEGTEFMPARPIMGDEERLAAMFHSLADDWLASYARERM